jgi:hypothetical protein
MKLASRVSLLANNWKVNKVGYYRRKHFTMPSLKADGRRTVTERLALSLNRLYFSG